MFQCYDSEPPEIPQNFSAELALKEGRNKRLIGGTSGHQSYLSPLTYQVSFLLVSDVIFYI